MKAFFEGAANVIYSKDAQHFAGHGAHEIAAALFGNGHAFVMYPSAGKNENLGQDQSQIQALQLDMQPSQEMERGRSRDVIRNFGRGVCPSSFSERSLNNG
jgi:hypothetical protein